MLLLVVAFAAARDLYTFMFEEEFRGRPGDATRGAPEPLCEDRAEVVGEEEEEVEEVEVVVVRLEALEREKVLEALRRALRRCCVAEERGILCKEMS